LQRNRPAQWRRSQRCDVDGGLEQRFELLLTDAGLVAERHAKDLPGRPDFVFRRQRMVVFTAGDFLAWLAVLGL
jgi:G:T-mismatch repair DNA endonuclease (very short patch repair protein)